MTVAIAQFLRNQNEDFEHGRQTTKTDSIKNTVWNR
jgi:hypothetical protein